MDFENDFSLKEWAKDKPLSILQLDPADRAVLRIADERDAIQKKTFTKWVNKHLKKHWICSKTYTQICICPESTTIGSNANRHVTDLFTDLQDGLNLISLLEVLSGEHLHREKGRMRFHCLQNVELVLNFLRYKKIKLVNIRPEDIVDGNPKLTLGLIWTIILHYQISDIVVGEEANVVSAKDVLLRWARKSTAKYPGVKVQDFTSSWRDGLAFNAIIHRNRPDLLDWRQIKSRTVRERLETAFYTAEKVGVTRLLDPEDVDTHEPDEKSIITYISSMYDVFPEPPAAHPLYDNESQAITTEYREIASSLHLWLREKTSIMSDRTMPASYTELKRLSQESTRFKTEEIPSKQRDKQRLQHLYRDLQKLYESTGEVEIEPELHIEILERNWTKLITLHQERDQLIQDELKKSERLDRLAERVSRDSKRIDSRLDDVESRLNEEARRLERLHPLDAKRNAETLETEMRSIEDSIQSLFHDTATLKSAGHHAAHDLHKKVTKLHQKWVTLRSALHQKLFARLATMSFPVVEERTVTRQTRTVLETRLVDTNHHFRSLQQAIEWCKTKLKMLHESEFGNDLPGVKIELSHHQREHKEIDRFQSTVDQCANAKNQFQGEEQTLYLQHLNTLHKIYSELLTTSNKRLADLESLQDLLQSVQNQLSWLEDKINVEIVRDFSDLDMNLTAVHQYHEALMSELEKREVSVRSVIERGNSLSLQGHPAASKVIHKWTETLKETWSRLLQFSLACEIHTAAMRKCQEFNRDLREAEAWLQSRDELLNTVYSASEFSLDEGERLLKGMQELREELNKKAPVFAELAARAPDIAPMRQRRLPVTRPMQVTAVCNYTNENVYIEKEDPWVLHDNSALTQWRVSSLGSRPPAGDTNVPGVVFAIPPPSRDALDGAERLNRSFERTTALWQRKQTRLRQNMIFATIRVVRSWDLPQFVGMGSEQRTAIRRALNEDADKLLSEGDPTDPQLRRLRREMEEVNRLFEEFERRARQEDENKTALREFTEQINTLQSSLDEAERTLNMRIVSSIPRDVHSLEHLVIQHKDFETDLKVLTPQVENIQTSFNILPRKSAALQNRLDAVLSQWNMLWNYSHLYIERLKCIEIILASLDEASNVVSELELKLASFGDMPSELEPLQNVHDDLIRLQNAIAARQPVVDQLIDEAKNTRRVVVRSRDRSSERDHSDLDRLDDEVNSVTQRWNELCAQLVDRLRSCEAAYSLLDNYGKTYQTEVKFIDEAYTQLNNLPPVSHAKHHIEPTKVLFTSIVERTQPLEQVNIDGGRFIREAKQAMEEKYKLCDDGLRQLLEWIGDLEVRLANQEPAKEHLDGIRNQINLLKLIKEELESQQRVIQSCLDDVRTVVSTGAEFLTRDEVSGLERNSKSLKNRVDKANTSTDKMLHRIISAAEELHKFRSETTIFTEWLEKTKRIVTEKERTMSLQRNDGSVSELLGDVISHQADLRFITMAGQKFTDESKEFLNAVNEYRSTLSSRPGPVDALQGNELRGLVSELNKQYKELLAKLTGISEKLSQLGSKEVEYTQALERLREWMRVAAPNANKIISEPLAADPHSLEEQLNRTKVTNTDFISQGRLVDNLRQALESLLRSVEGTASRTEINELTSPVNDLTNRYESLCTSLQQRVSILENALSQSQGVEDAIDSVVGWLSTAENNFKAISRPASLVKERLDEQVRELRLLLSDVSNRRGSLETVVSQAKSLVAQATNPRLAKRIDTKLKDILSRYEKLSERASKRSELLTEVTAGLDEFSGRATELERWLQESLESLETGASGENLNHEKELRTESYERTLRDGRTLLAKKDVTDTSQVRDRIKNIETQWRELSAILDERVRLAKLRAEQSLAYEKLREQVLSWLNGFENRVSRLEPIALNIDVIKKQMDELKPLVKEHREYAPTIDKLFDLGNSLAAFDRPESPTRRRTSVSPVKRLSTTIGRRTSIEITSPSPTKSLYTSVTSPLSPGSSGFGSRRSSQDAFHLEGQFHDLTGVQQELADINNRYSALGVRLSDRNSELESVRVELKKWLDHLRSLDQFLDRIQRSLPAPSLPPNKETADKMNVVVKGLLEEMYEKHSALESTKIGVTELLKKKPQAPGSDVLQQQLNEVTSKWKSVNDACKNRIQLLEDLKDLYDTHDHLSAWLSSKERMLSALGPISPDPRMAGSQQEQVRVLREELRATLPQLTHLRDVSQTVLARAKSWTQLETRLKDINDRWDSLLKKLDQREDSLGAAMDSSKQLQLGLATLKNTLDNISDEIDSEKSEKQVEAKLKKIQGCERQLEGARQLLAEVESAGEQLCLVLTDQASRADIQSKLSDVNRQYTTLQAKLDQRKAEIEALLRDGREFDATVAKTLGWLNEELGSLSDRLMISADRDILQQQVDMHEAIYKEVIGKEHQVIMVLDKGNMLKTSSRNLDNLRALWEKLRKEAVDRQTRLQTSMDHCRKYYKSLENFIPWLSQAENKLDSLRPDSFTRRDLDKHLRDLASFRNDVWKKSGEFEHIKSLSETFVSSCDIHKEIVLQEVASVKSRWDKLNNELLHKTSSLEELGRRLADATDRLRSLSHSVQRCEDRLGSHDSLATHTDPATLHRLSALRDEVVALRKPLESLCTVCSDLDAEVAHFSPGRTSGLSEDVAAISERLDDLSARLDDRCDRANSAAKEVQRYNDKVKQLTVDLTSLEEELDGMKPPGRDVKTLRGQQDQLSAFNTKVNRAADDVSVMMSLADSLVDSGFSPDATRQQAENVSKRLALLEEGSRAREEALESALDKLAEFEDRAREASNLVDRAMEEVRRLKPVGSEVETIRSQQAESSRVRADFVEPAGLSVERALNLGQALVQSAAPGVGTQQLERDQEKLADKWNNLKEKMNERDRKLDVGLLQSGKFQEALEGLSKWLSDTEEMVANQRPPSADYKVVKAQLQEQKFLKKMLLDRQGSMSSLVAMGREVAADCDASERAGIERSLRSLADRFDDLTEKAETRMRALEQAMGVAKLFQDKLNPVVDWLDKTEKKIKDMELVPTDEEKIQEKIREHHATHEEILRKKPALAELTEIASELMSLVGEDEACAVADKVQEVADRYSALAVTSDGVGSLLERSRTGLRHLVLTYQQLQGWMEGMEQRLSKYKVLAVHTDQLLAQMEDLADLTEEISNHQTDVDSTVDTGLELMRNISSDEAIQLKDKLDSLQRRYNELTTRGADLLKQTQEALPLVQQFHNAHYRLADWMHGAETTLQNDPREDSIHTLEMDIQEFRPVLENVNQLGPQLCAIGPGEGSATIEGLVTRDNRRFDAIAEQVQRKAERLHLSKQRSLEVLGDVDSLLEWFREVEAQLREAEPPSAEPNVIRLQLKEHKALNDDIASQKGRVRDVLDTAKKVLRESPQYEDNSVMRDKMSDLRETMDSVWTASGVRLGLLEQALGLSSHFEESHCELVSWLGETEQQVRSLPPPALRPQAIAQQEDRTEMLLQSISEHKPLVDKLNKTGEALIKLVAYDEGAKLQEMLDSDNSRYDSLRASLKARQEALEKAMQESSQFSDKLEGMLRALGNTADEVNSVEPVAAHPPKIRQQMKENQAFVDEVAKREEAFEAVKKAAIDVIAKSPSDPAVRDVKKKLDKLQQLWTEINDITKTRNKSLSEALEVAARFWSQLESVMGSLSQIEASLVAQEPPALRPDAIKRQEEALDEIKTEIDQTKPRVDEVRKTGASLMALCGEPDKPEVRKHIEDLDTAWDTVTSLFAKREENLLHAMDRAMEFHDSLRTLKEFLSGAEQKFSSLGPLGTEIEVVKKQLAEMKEFKAEVDPMMVKVEALNRQAAELTERSSVEQAQGLKDSLSAVNTRWDELHRGIAERNRQLENALLRLGHFQHALSELLAWIQATEGTLDSEIGEIVLDPRLMQIQLAKLKVLMNDMTAHQTSVDTLNDAGRQLIEAGRGNASTIQTDLDSLNRQWTRVLEKAANKQADLEQALSDVHRFTTEIQDAVSWLGEVDAVIASSKPVGGLAETAQEQLDRFMVVYDELESSRPRVEGILSRGHEYLRRSPATSGSDAPSHLQTSLKTLKTRWDSVTARANDKKIKLEIALKEATEFHEALQSFVNWLTSAEKTLSNLKPVSRVLETILGQIEEHKAFQKEVGVHRETMIQLDKKGTHLKYFSQKQDVILIKNLLISVQHRWERVVSKSAERTRALDHGYKEAKDFHDSWSALTTWLQETDKKLDEISAEINSAANDPQKLKQRLAKHRETQKAIAAKQPTYDATVRAGKQLRERSPKQDEPHLKAMITQLKELWITVCNKAVDRQRKLEEALLYCGQVKDALDALLDWLRKVHKELAEDGPVHGDLDTVQALIEQHKALEQELQNRHPQVESVEKSGHELASKSDGHNMSDQVSEMTDLWRKTNSLAQKRGVKLQEALKQAEELHKSVHMLLEWLSDAEMRLRFVDNLPDDETDTRIQISEHEKFMREMRDKEREKDSTVRLAEEILAKAHPDGGAVVKHWITIIQSRWEEVTSWAKQREERLRAHLRALQEMDTLLEELLSWLGNNEGTLIALEHQELPNSIPPTEVLITEHQEFMESMAKRTTEVDTVIKAKQIKERKVSKKTSKEETRTSTQELSDLSRRQSLKSSREHLGTLDRKGSRTSPGRDVGDLGLPHIGPKFPAKGSKIPEPQFKCARSRLLYDRWRSVWLMSWERQRRLRDHLNHLAELERLANFSWDEWRKRFLKFMNHKKSRLTDLFRKMDKNNDGLIPRDDFIEGVIKTKFDTSRLEMGAVADMFDHNSEGYIDWKEFIAALRPDWEERKPVTEAEKIHDEVKRLVMLCTCRQKFRVFQVGEGKYRFGDSQKLRLVRILRSTVMVRVGGGWVALEEFLIKNDPCRVEMLPIPNPFVPEEHEAWCPLARKRSTGELLSELMPIFESLREREREAQRSFPITLAQRIHSSSTPHTCQIREKSARSVPMGGDSRGSDTPDYLTPRKSSRSALTPGGSLPGSRTNSRPASRQGSKPPSRHGSSLSLASSEEGTPSRIPRRSVPSRTNSTASSAQRKLTAPSTLNGTKSPTTPTSRSKIPIYTGANTNSIHSTSSFGKSRIPVAVGRHSSCSSSSTGTNLSLNLRSSSTSVSSKRRPSTDKSEI
ncbi:dystonin-like protein short stop isoform X27 [Rhodnius prolixus]|uniref:dystonin-like protein short stop isoform X27 n=1 Tax=Rhodnius prolixus TaxID=13249 RepID=UPI003D189217